jgi:hypothetical protein
MLNEILFEDPESILYPPANENRFLLYDHAEKKLVTRQINFSQKKNKKKSRNFS